MKTFTLLGPRLVKFGEDSIGQRGPSHTILEVFESTYSVLSNFFLLMVPLTPSLWLWLGYTFPTYRDSMDPPPSSVLFIRSNEHPQISCWSLECMC